MKITIVIICILVFIIGSVLLYEPKVDIKPEYVDAPQNTMHLQTSAPLIRAPYNTEKKMIKSNSHIDTDTLEINSNELPKDKA